MLALGSKHPTVVGAPEIFIKQELGKDMDKGGNKPDGHEDKSKEKRKLVGHEEFFYHAHDDDFAQFYFLCFCLYSCHSHVAYHNQYDGHHYQESGIVVGGMTRRCRRGAPCQRE